MFSEVTVFYRDLDFQGVQSPQLSERPILHPLSPDESAKGALYHERRFNAFRTMHEVQNFRLVLCADVWDVLGEYMIRILKQAVAAEKAKRGFDGIFPEPLVVYSPRGSRQRFMESMESTLGPWIPL